MKSEDIIITLIYSNMQLSKPSERIVSSRVHFGDKILICAYATDKDSLFLEENKVKCTTLLYQEMLKHIEQTNQKKTEICEEEHKTKENANSKKRLIKDHLDCDARSINCLLSSDILYIEDLIKLTRKDLLKIQNLGPRSLARIVDELSEINLHLAE